MTNFIPSILYPFIINKKKRRMDNEVLINKEMIQVALHRKTLFIGGLICGTLDYSETAKKWYLKLSGFSDSFYELNTKEEGIELCQQEFFDFLKDISVCP
jgi:hypothetical protein